MKATIQPFFHPYAVTELKKFILVNGRQKKLQKGEYHKNHDGQLSTISLIESGLCYYQYLSQYSEEIIAIARPGSVMGDASFLAPMNIPMHVIAKRPTSILYVTFDEVKDFCAKNRDVYDMIVANAVIKFQCYVEGMLINFTMPPEQRLRFLLKSIVNAHIQPSGQWKPLKLRLSNEEYGEIIHASRVTVNRILSQWKEEGFIKKEGRDTFINSNLYEGIEL